MDSDFPYTSLDEPSVKGPWSFLCNG
jgi:hypothetical protein